MKLERDEIRLECIKLAASRSPDHQEALKRAESYYEFVMEPEEPKPQAKFVSPPKVERKDR